MGFLRDFLEKHKEGVTERIWTVAAQPGETIGRLRAATALARYDPDSPRWADVQKPLSAWPGSSRPTSRTGAPFARME